MILFHVTTKVYEVGQTVSVDNFEGETCYYNEKDDRHRDVNRMMDENRPEGEPERKKCIYLSDKLENCIIFAVSESLLLNENVFLYEVDLDAQAHPMLLVNKIGKEQNETRKLELIREYWNPTQDWQYNEYLTSQMTIISKRELKTSFSKQEKERLCEFGRLHYMRDYDTFKRIYN